MEAERRPYGTALDYGTITRSESIGQLKHISARSIQPLVGVAMSRPTTTLLLLGVHLIGAPIGVLSTKLRLVNAIYSGPDNLSLLEWIFDYGYNEEVTPRPVKVSFEHRDFDPEIHDCFPNESSAQQAFDKVSEYCVELATVNGNDFRSKPVVPYEDGVYTFRLIHGNQTVRAPVFYIDVDVAGVTTAPVEADQLTPPTVSNCPPTTSISTRRPTGKRASSEVTGSSPITDPTPRLNSPFNHDANDITVI